MLTHQCYRNNLGVSFCSSAKVSASSAFCGSFQVCKVHLSPLKPGIPLVALRFHNNHFHPSPSLPSLTIVVLFSSREMCTYGNGRQKWSSFSSLGGFLIHQFATIRARVSCSCLGFWFPSLINWCNGISAVGGEGPLSTMPVIVTADDWTAIHH